eukprot:969356-Pyramimonas_sp.AAC.1
MVASYVMFAARGWSGAQRSSHTEEQPPFELFHRFHQDSGLVRARYNKPCVEALLSPPKGFQPVCGGLQRARHVPDFAGEVHEAQKGFHGGDAGGFDGRNLEGPTHELRMCDHLVALHELRPRL